MQRNSEKTTAYILEKVAPVFNKKGYMGTSFSDLNEATQLTKGAIYCNFSNKEELAIRAFKHNVKEVIGPLSTEMEKYENSVDKLFAMTKFYRKYYNIAKLRGGCPVLNVGVDARFNNPELYKAVKEVSHKLLKSLVAIIQAGINKGEINDKINAEKMGGNIYSMIEGGIFMASTLNDKMHIINILDLIDGLIKEKIRK